jgi:hypothetical protein
MTLRKNTGPPERRNLANRKKINISVQWHDGESLDEVLDAADRKMFGEKPVARNCSSAPTL